MSDELTDIYDGAEPRLVIRLSQTASGSRTYTVGTSVPLRSSVEDDADAIARVFAIDSLVRDMLNAPIKPTRAPDASIAPALAASLVALETPNDGAGGWYTGEQLAAKMGKSRRTLRRYVEHGLAAGAIEARIGGGRGKPTMYRVIPTAAS